MSAYPNRYAFLSPDSALAGMLQAFGAIGAAQIITKVLAGFHPDWARVPIDARRYTLGPVIWHTRSGEAGDYGWHDPEALRKKWYPRVMLERAEILLGLRPDWVSPAEIMVVMHNATMDAPLPDRVSEVYLWAVRRMFEGMGTPMPSFADGTGPDPTDRDVLDERGRLHQVYGDIAGEIRRKVIAEVLVREAEARREERAAKAAEAAEAAAGEPTAETELPAADHRSAAE